MNYTEEQSRTANSKQQYLAGLNHLIAQRQKQAAGIRAEYIKDIFKESERYRADFCEMLGWPLVSHQKEGLPNVTAEKLSDEDGYCIYRMSFEVIDGLIMSGLFFRQNSVEPQPLVIVQHGGLGTPEHISGFYGSTTNYNDMLHRVRQQGVHVFAPQLLLWGENYQVEFKRETMDAQLKRVGSSITAVEVYGITRILDYFEVQSYVSCFGMLGLSYGGFYTLCTAAVDKRIRSAVSCSFFNKRDAVGWSDWVWNKSAEKFDDAEIACLIYPRKLCIEMGDHDPLFDSQYSIESFERLKEMCQDVGTDWVDFIVFEGVHEFYKNDEPILRMVEELR